MCYTCINELYRTFVPGFLGLVLHCDFAYARKVLKCVDLESMCLLKLFNKVEQFVNLERDKEEEEVAVVEEVAVMSNILPSSPDFLMSPPV